MCNLGCKLLHAPVPSYVLVPDFLVINYVHFLLSLFIFIYLFLAQVVSVYLYYFRKPS